MKKRDFLSFKINFVFLFFDNSKWRLTWCWNAWRAWSQEMSDDRAFMEGKTTMASDGKCCKRALVAHATVAKEEE